MSLRSVPARFRRTVCAIAVIATVAALGPVLVTPTAAAAPARLSAGGVQSALALAAQTDEPVSVDADTTPYSLTTALPDGTLDATFNPAPVRVFQGGAWTAIDPTLQQNGDGSYSPAAVLSDLRLSGGGTGPLAELDNHGDTLSLSWPQALPTPTIDGATATYPDVLPGVDLAVTATTLGGLSEVFIVKTPAAAQDPGLDQLRFATATSSGMNLSVDAAGNLSGTDAQGNEVFHAPTPLMWDSGPAPATPSAPIQPSVVGDQSGVDTPSSDPADSTDPASAPPTDAHVAALAVDLDPSAVTLTPDKQMLDAPDTTYPVYIDPTLATGKGNLSGWDWAQEAFPNTSWWKTDTNGKPAVGYQGWDPQYQGRNRSYYQFDIGNLNHADIRSATFGATEVDTGLFDCDTTRKIQAWATSPIDANTTWNNQPGASYLLDTADVPGASNANGCLNRNVSWNVLDELVKSADSVVTFRLQAADETDKTFYRRFNDTNATLEIHYNFRPDTPTNLAITPTLRSPNDTCGVDPTQAGWLGKDDNFTLKAKISDPDGNKQTLQAQYQVWDRSVDPDRTIVGFGGEYQSAEYGGSTTGIVAPSQQIKTPKLDNGHNYGWDVRAVDNSGVDSNTSPTSDHCYFWYDGASPTTPHVTSDDFNLNHSTKHAGQAGTFQLESTDPGPDPGPGRASGIDHFEYSLTSASELAGDQGTHKSATNGAATITITPRLWGINYLYVAAVDNAGNLSGTKTYPFYVPDDPNATVHPGDVDGDGHPDLLAGNTATDDLYLLEPTTPVYVTDISAAVNSPNGASWKNTLLAHRSSTTRSASGGRVDDLWAHQPGSNDLYFYPNDSAQVGDPIFTTHSTVPKPICTSDCGNYHYGDWSQVTQMLAPGSINGDDYPDLLTVENGNLWLYPGTTVSGKLGDAIILKEASAATQPDWDNWRIIAPGDDTGADSGSDPANPTYTPDLWAADNRGATGTETIRLYPINYATTTGLTTLGDPTSNQGTAQWGTDHRRLLASPGDTDRDDTPDIVSLTTSATGSPSQIWENPGTSKDPGHLSFGPHQVLDDGTGNHNWDNFTNLS